MMAQSQFDAVSLIRLTYVSQSAKAINIEELQNILIKARENNRQNGISGLLCFNNQVFLQTIEGSRERINRLYATLLNDTRHTNIQLIEVVEIQSRIWSEWSMGYATPTKENQAIFLRHSPTERFNPYLLNASNAKGLLMDLSNNIVKN